MEQLLTEKVVLKCINMMEQIVDNQIVLYTLKTFSELRNDFQQMYDTIVRNTMYFMESIYDGIDVPIPTVMLKHNIYFSVFWKFI